MPKQPSPNPELDLIRLLYHETSQPERDRIVPELLGTPTQQDEFDGLLDLKRQLDLIAAEELIPQTRLSAAQALRKAAQR
jgi:hypothetical protein